MTKLFVAAVLTLISSPAFAQTADSTSARPARTQDPTPIGDSLGTPAGHELSVSVAGYSYAEPGAPGITIHGPKIGGEYTGTTSIGRNRHWFAQANVRGILGNVTYDGWCSPWLITPESTSPNGYALDLGDLSPCSEKDDQDSYLETRALFGKDLIGRNWVFAPATGVGFRHLSNGTTGVAGYRTDDYLYLPFGLTARTNVASHSTLSFNVEYDRLIHGWQNTHDSALGGGFIPATPTAPGFTIEGFSDISFAQSQGWALRASAKYRVAPHVSLEPYYVHWSVSASAVNFENATFTVNHVTAIQQLGAYEPFNTTNEFGLKLGFPF